jgi:hypothetical protein
MTIDERLDALTQSVELLSHTGQATDRRINQLTSLIQQDAENIRALARIAEAHEHRIGDIEDGRN